MNNNSRNITKLQKNPFSFFKIIGIIFLIVFIGRTFANYEWASSEEEWSKLTFFVNKDDFSCAADGGGNITSDDVSLVPTDCLNSEYAIQREIKVMSSINRDSLKVSMDLWLDIKKLGKGLSDSKEFRYALTTNNNSCTEGIVTEGNFNTKTVGEKINLLSDKRFLTTSDDMYYLYIWIEDVEENDPATINQEFDLSLNGSCIGSIVENKPVLDDGMIPVTISDDGVVTTIDEDDENWYDYGKEKWANIVLVNENVTDNVDGSKSREYYLNNDGVTILESDILAYYVWIPRYKYKIWTTDVSSAGNKQEIDIQFESKNEPMSLGTSVGEFRTHPAFWFDINSDSNIDNSELMSGIWVGKFETTGTADKPMILPNVQSLTNQNVSTQFQTGLKFSGGLMNISTGEVTFSGNNTYGLTIDTDSHMMKNSEWGAVAYLSHSQYGINDEVRINNYYNNGTLTGCGALTPDESESTTCGISYGDVLEYPQSTTGNITGVYDMSGGSSEYAMGILADSNGNPLSGNSSYNSGFNGTIYDSGNNTEYTEGIAFPNSKYYDLYTTTNKITACNGSVCYGHSLSETASWYSDYANFVGSDNPWFVRGGNYNNGASAGAFGSNISNGNSSGGSSWRSVLITFEMYEVIFDTNGGNDIDSKKVFLNSSYGELPVPIRTGYKFLGWYTELDGGKLITQDSIMNFEENITLYAHWEELAKYTISFDANGGSGAPESQIKFHGEDLILSEITPTKTDYVFLGWHTSSDAVSAMYTAKSVYSINESITLYAIWANSKYNVIFDTNGGFILSTQDYLSSGEYTYEVTAGTSYQLEVWGAQGGTPHSTYIGGYGGYSVGTFTPTSNETLYINVGGQGSTATGTYKYPSGGYNGGGKGATSNYGSGYKVGGGGGATHIATSSGELSTLSQYVGNHNSPILIVAGGGGGGSYWDSTYKKAGGHGGGFNGVKGSGSGGTQTSGAAFGKGANSSMTGSNSDTKSGGGGGGGGYYGGKAGGGAGSSGGGGSGYIGNNLLTNKVMYCYSCTESSATDTLTYSTTSVSATATSNYAKSGGGAAKITAYNTSLSYQVTYGSLYENISTPIRTGYIFAGWFTEQDGGVQITESTIVDIVGEHTLYARWIDVNSPITSYNCANSSLGNEPKFTYTGDCIVLDDGNGDWRIKFLTTGTFTSNIDMEIDAFLVGGGGGGSKSSGNYYGAGGGGGYTKTVNNVSVNTGTSYIITIGTGGSVTNAGNSTFAFENTANGGGAGGTIVSNTRSGSGGTGGSGGGGGAGNTGIGGNGGSDGSSGGAGGGSGSQGYAGGGQGTTTREFGENSGALYSGGGGGCGETVGIGGAGGGAGGTTSITNNSGGGGVCGGSGGSGIVIIRNKR